MKTLTATPEQSNANKVLLDHVKATLESANKGEIPIPNAVKARIIVAQIQEYLNNQLKNKRTLTPEGKKMIAVAKENILNAFDEQQVPKPSVLIDEFLTNSGVRFRMVWSKAIENQFTIDQLQAMPAADEATQKVVDNAVASLKAGKSYV